MLAGRPNDALTDWPSDKEAPTRNRECYSYAYASPDSSDYATFQAVVQLEGDACDPQP